ncbi:unnamed protein product [Alopecurus aequalis]
MEMRVLLPLLAGVLLMAAGGADGDCERSCGAMTLPYPFGFSSGCTIPLSCDANGTAWLGDASELGLLVRNVTPCALILDLFPDCSRPFNASVAALFSGNHAPASTNALVVSSCSPAAEAAALTSNCSASPDSFLNRTSSHCKANESVRCIVPPTPPPPPRSNNSQGDHHFLNQSNMLSSGCTGLVTAVSYSEAQGPSLLLGKLELDWWVPGSCHCVPGANCTHFIAPTTGQEVFRCECPEGLVGDGFVDGAGCKREVSVSRCDSSKFLSADCGKKVPVGLLMAGVILGALVMGLSCIVCHLLKRRSASIRSLQSTKRLMSEADCTVPLYSYHEIERATGGFSESQRLGTGAYGTVYAGRLSDNRLVAVKRIKQRDSAAEGLDCVMNEVKLVSSVSHRNLIRLLGCCIEQGQQILVYEFMSNGTLAQHLQRERGPAVPWTVRLRMAAETAKAIAYLHSEVHPPIYHRDIKSSNILLDHEYNSKVADFGLSRMGMTSVETSHISTAPQGTPGYVDPQYHQNFHLSDKSDVYSFGVVLVEIITAMKVVDFSRRPCEVNLAQLAVEKIGRGCVDDIIDPYLDPHRDAWTLTSIHKVAELAFRCLAFHSEIRPSMAEVADELEQIQVSGWAPSTDDTVFMSTTSSLCSSAPSRGTDKSVAPPPVKALVDTEKGAVGLSPVSVQERWFSDRSSPSSSSLLGNNSSLQ